MAITQAFLLDAVTIGSSEVSILSGTTSLQTNTDDGVYFLFVDASAMQKGDEFIIRVYEKVKSTGTKRVCFDATLSDQQSQNFLIPGILLIHGWDMTIQKVAGTDRAFDASIRKVA